MINVSRKGIKKPKSIAGKKSVGVTKKKEALLFFSKKKNKLKTFSFVYYNSDDVKEALEKIFSKKCAYCETRYTAASLLDVEHFRPKAAVKDHKTGKIIKPGYYWLAWEWSNLFPVCQNCNRRQYRKIFGKTKKILAGKGELFPIADENKRANSPGGEKREVPLLLNPLLDLPEEHLHFTDEGFVFPMIRKGSASKKGEISIEIYGLMREELIDDRRLVLKTLEARIKNIKRFDSLCKASPKNKEHKISLKNEMDELHEYLNKERPYLGMVRQIIKEKLGI